MRTPRINEAKLLFRWFSCWGKSEQVSTRAKKIAKELISLYPDFSPVAIIELAREDGHFKRLGVSDIREVWHVLQAVKKLSA